MSRLLQRPLALAATGVVLAAPSLILPPADIPRRESVVAARTGRQDALPLDALFAAGHLAPGLIGQASGGADGPAPTFVAASADGSGTTVAMPAGWAAGDLLIIFATAYKAGTTCSGHITPAGWTELGSWTNGYQGTYMSRTKVFHRIAQSGDAAPSLTRPAGESAYVSCMLAFRGVNAASPFEALATLSEQSAASSIPYAQIATLGANRVVVQAITGFTIGTMTSSPHSGWTERFDSGNSISLAIDTRVFASAGLTSAGYQTRDGSYEWGRMAFAIKPAPA